jgi:metallo-beta-lactamase family protein
VPVEFHKSYQLSPKFSFNFVHAGHILGSGMVEVLLGDGNTKRMLFSGDIGRVRNGGKPTPGCCVHEGPEMGESTELLVMESTYGNRVHPKEDPRPQLAKLIRDAVGRGGSVIVPAFAVERTQKFVFLIKDLMEAGDIPRVPVFVDSPMAIKAVNIFLKHSDEFTESTKALIGKYGSPLTWPGFTFASDVNESKKINENKFPSIIVSSSGMVTGGRILHHLRLRVSDPRHLILFIGFQAPGTRGFTIKSGAPTVKIFGEELPIKAQVAFLEQFSDHADTAELLQWLRTFKSQPRVTYLVHGEPEASQKLQQALSQELKWDVRVAQWMEKVEI